MNYEESVQIIYLAQNRFEPQKVENWSLVQKVFDHSYFYSGEAEFDFTMKDEKVVRYMDNNYPLLTYDPVLLQQIRNWASNSSTNYRVEIKLLDDAKKIAIVAIDGLRKEYHLNN